MKHRWSVWLNGGLFAAGFFLVVSALRPAYSDGWLLTAKQRHIEVSLNDYDAVFLGSSRIYRAFDAPLFAQLTESQGRRIRTYNFGVPGLRPHEMDMLLDDIIAAKPSRLKYVFIEVMQWYPPVLNDLKHSDRTVNWHNLERTRDAIHTVWKQEVDTSQKWSETLTHLEYFMHRATNFGRGLQRIAQWMFLPRQTNTLDRQFGFVATDQERGAYYDRRRALFLKDYRDICLKQIEEIDARNADKGSLATFPLTTLLRQQKRIKEAGLTPIYVLPNVRWGTPDLHLLKANGHLDTMLIFNRRKKFPGLYIEEHYFDRGHLNGRGARCFTQHLVDELFQADLFLPRR